MDHGHHVQLGMLLLNHVKVMLYFSFQYGPMDTLTSTPRIMIVQCKKGLNGQGQYKYMQVHGTWRVLKGH